MSMIEDAIRAIQNRVMMIVGRAILEAVKDDEGIQKLKMSLLAGEDRDGMERFQNYGFTSNPLPGAEGVVVFPGGNRDHGLVIAIDDRRFRLKGLAQGEVALYTDQGDKIHFKRGGTIEVTASTEVKVTSPKVSLGSGTLEAILNGATFKAFFDTHTHTTVGIGLPTSPPIVPSPPTVLSTVVSAAK